MFDNFPKLMGDIKPQIQEVQQTSGRINTKKSKSKHIIVNMLNTEVEGENKNQQHISKQMKEM